MAKPFFNRLRAYYLKVAEVLRGEADAAAVFPNSTDVGQSRERVYAEFLTQHVPSKCNIFLGGFIFDEEGQESKQLDIIITTDTTPQFNLHNPNNTGKSFSPIEGTLCAVSVKSNLDRKELRNALDGISSIPPTRPLDGRVNPLRKIERYEDWPLRIIYASSGILPATLIRHIEEYYAEHPDIPHERRPNYIHIAGSALIIRAQSGAVLVDTVTGIETTPDHGTFHPLTKDPDLQAIVWILNDIQYKASASTQIAYNYTQIIAKILNT